MGQLVSLSFDKIMQTRAYTVVILSARTKSFAIYTEPHVGKLLQQLLTGEAARRPLTHRFVSSLLEGLQVNLTQVIINDVQDTIYYARLFVEQPLGDLKHIVEIDCRPSDALILALMNQVPLYCTQDVLQRTIPIEEP